MLESEYITLMGYDTDDINEGFIYEFEEANEAYMACSDSMDKQRFCEDWKKHKDSEIITDLSAQCQALTHKVEELRGIINNGVDELIGVMNGLQNAIPDGNTIRELEECIDTILFIITDRKTIIRKKLDADVDLNEFDHAYITENLK